METFEKLLHLQFFLHWFSLFMTRCLSVNCICFHRALPPTTSGKFSSLPPKCMAHFSKKVFCFRSVYAANNHLPFLPWFTPLKNSLVKSPRFLSFLFFKSPEESSHIELHSAICSQNASSKGAFASHTPGLDTQSSVTLCLCLLLCPLLLSEAHLWQLLGWKYPSGCLFCSKRHSEISFSFSVEKSITHHQHWTSPNSLSTLGYK